MMQLGVPVKTAEIDEGKHLIDAASPFESAVLADVTVEGLDQDLLNHFSHHTASNSAEQIWRSSGEALQARGLAVRGKAHDVFYATAAAYILFGQRPANRFPHCEILADAYDDVRIHGRPKGQASINAPLPHALEQALKFVDDHTFHPRRVVGLNNLRLDEYPVAALREAVVNAVAHRSYDDSSRKVFVRVFRDRIEISSPGYPPQPLTLAKLRRGGYRPCSRNPLIAQTLATLGVMEQRGSGFVRIRDAMLNHGLDEAKITQEDGFFVVTLPGPDGNYDRLKVAAGVTGPITPAIEAQLNDRQKKMVGLLAAGEELTSRRCEKEFGVTRPVTAKDFANLIQLGLAEKVGSGRSTRYRAAIVK